MLKNAGLVASTSDGNRMIDQGAVRVGESAETLTKVAGRDHSLSAGTFLIQVGKHKYRWVALQNALAGRLDGLFVPTPRSNRADIRGISGKENCLFTSMV